MLYGAPTTHLHYCVLHYYRGRWFRHLRFTFVFPSVLMATINSSDHVKPGVKPPPHNIWGLAPQTKQSALMNSEYYWKDYNLIFPVLVIAGVTPLSGAYTTSPAYQGRQSLAQLCSTFPIELKINIRNIKKNIKKTSEYSLTACKLNLNILCRESNSCPSVRGRVVSNN